MVAGASWGESAWDADEDDLLVLEFLGGIVGDGNAADFGVGSGPWDVLELDCAAYQIMAPNIHSHHRSYLMTHRPLGKPRRP